MKLEDLKPNIRVRGIDPAGEVKVLHVEVLGPDAVTLTYQRASGPVGQETLFRNDEAKLEEVDLPRASLRRQPAGPAGIRARTIACRSGRPAIISAARSTTARPWPVSSSRSCRTSRKPRASSPIGPPLRAQALGATRRPLQRARHELARIVERSREAGLVGQQLEFGG